MIRPVFTRLSLLLALLALSGLAPGRPPAVYAATGSASPGELRAGERVHFSAAGFTPGERIDLWITFPDGGSVPRFPSIEAGPDGGALWSWDVPAGAPAGTYYAGARGTRSEQRLAVGFRVIDGAGASGPQLQVTPARGGPGTTFVFSADGFKPDEEIGAWVSDPSGRDRDLAADAKPRIPVDDQGRVSWSFTAPADAPAGQWIGRARGFESGREVAIPFTIDNSPPSQPDRSITPTAGPPGTVFTVRVAGLQPGEQVGTWLNQPDGRRRDATPYLYADDKGVATWSWASPADAPSGRWQAVTRGIDSASEVVLDFELTGSNPGPATPTIRGSVTPASGPPGTIFNFTAQGFYPGEKVFYWPTGPDGMPISNDETVDADSAGEVQFSWEAPRLAGAGSWLMNVRGEGTRLEGRIPFTIEAPQNGPSISVTPTSGQPGTTFAFRATGYNDIEKLDTWLEDPNGVRRDGPTGVRANRDGIVTWEWTAPADAIAGNWTMIARGEDTLLLQRAVVSIIRETPPPAGPPASVSPARGPRGTTFTFRAGGYERGERVGYWLNAPDGSIVRFDQEAGADRDGFVTITWTAPADAQRGRWIMALRSSQSDRVPNDVSHQIPFVVE